MELLRDTVRGLEMYSNAGERKEVEKVVDAIGDGAVIVRESLREKRGIGKRVRSF